ncbi:chromosome segregation protein ScpA [Alicyclobacillaceae bacterium I2511]|nr:chromosome segregation protein ScpA [Alicyclobacillaceae bacterium I2511]
MTYEVVLDTFNGPLDLLLHLIQKQEMNIHDIQIAVIADQYLQYVRTMESLSLEVASDFIVMAATLLWIKSKMLLPHPQVIEELESPSEADPRAEIIRQLVEYQQIKWAVVRLNERGVTQSQLYARQPMDLRHFAVQTILEQSSDLSIWDLIDSFHNLLTRISVLPPVAHIKGKTVTVEERMEELLIYIRKVVRSSFFELTRLEYSRNEVVTTFLALLELIKAGNIRCLQSIALGEIVIELSERKSN